MKEKINKKVVVLSLIALLCLYLTYKLHWAFIVPVAVILWINQKELIG